MKKSSVGLWCVLVFLLVSGLFWGETAHGSLRDALLKAAEAPADAAAQAELARAYNLNKEPGKAFSSARQALDLMPGFPPALLELAHASRMVGDHREAVRLYEMYLAEEPKSVEALAGNSESLARLERWDESFASAMAAIREAPKKAEGYGALGRAYRIAGRFEEAVDFREILPEDPVKFDFVLTRFGIRKELSEPSFLDKCQGALNYASAGHSGSSISSQKLQ